MRRQTNTINWGSELPLAQGIKFDLGEADTAKSHRDTFERVPCHALFFARDSNPALVRAVQPTKISTNMQGQKLANGRRKIRGKTAQESPDLSQLLARARQGDRVLSRRFTGICAGRIVCAVPENDRRPGQAEDCAQETFVKAWRKLDGFRGDSSLTTWLHRIAVNEVLSMQRRAGRESRYLEAVASEPVSPTARRQARVKCWTSRRPSCGFLKGQGTCSCCVAFMVTSTGSSRVSRAGPRNL